MKNIKSTLWFNWYLLLITYTIWKPTWGMVWKYRYYKMKINFPLHKTGIIKVTSSTSYVSVFQGKVLAFFTKISDVIVQCLLQLFINFVTKMQTFFSFFNEKIVIVSNITVTNTLMMSLLFLPPMQQNSNI